MNRYIVNIARNDAAMSIRQPSLYVMFFAIPILVMSFLVPTYGQVLQDQGRPWANGSELVVPGMAVMFGFFVMSLAGFLVLNEYGDETWTRLRALPARPLDILTAKVVTPLTIALTQQALLFTAGVLLFDMSVRGPVLALVLISGAFGLTLAGLGIFVMAVARTAQQISLLSNISLLVLGGMGAAFAPPDLMPAWAQTAAQVTPGYWAIEAYRGVILDGDGVGDVVGPVAVLLAWAALGTFVGVTRYRNDIRRGRLS